MPLIRDVAPLVLGPVPEVPRCTLAVLRLAAFFGARFFLLAADFCFDLLDVFFAMTVVDRSSSTAMAISIAARLPDRQHHSAQRHSQNRV